MTNEAQIAHWSGEGGQNWVEHHERFDRMLEPFGRHVIEAVAPAAGERILDVGCGNGALTLDIAERVQPGGEAVGVDISGPMLQFARTRAAERGLDEVTFFEGDAQVHRFEPGSFDAIVSRFGVMFFDDPEVAFTNLASALRPGGRVAFACWRPIWDNEWMLVAVSALLEHVPPPPPSEPDAPGPFAFGDPDRVRTVLAAANLDAVELRPIDEPARIGRSLDDTMTFLRNSEMSRALLQDVPDETAARAWAAVERVLADYDGPDGVVMAGGAWLVTARGS